MIFMNGKSSDLQGYALKDINEMEAIGPAKRMNVVVQVSRIAQLPNPMNPAPVDRFYENWSGTRRYEIQKDEMSYRVTSPLRQDMGRNVDMGNWTNLADFGSWAKANYPAKRYMLIVWNHGDGWRNEKPQKSKFEKSKAISEDPESGNYISTNELASALGQMGGVDVYASDACLMQTIEVAYGLKNYASVITGSEANEPGDGYAYDVFFRALKTHSKPSPEAMAYYAVMSYRKFYSGTHATQSAVRGGRAMEEFRGILDDWADEAIKSGEAKILKEIKARTKSFDDFEMKDVIHFLELVKDIPYNPALEPLKAKSRDAVNYFYGNVLILNGVPPGQIPDAHGMTIYLPENENTFDPNYKRLAWAQESKWDEFIEWLLKKR